MSSQHKRTCNFARRLAAGMVILALALTGSACSLNIEGKQSALDPQGPVAQNQYDIFMLTLAVTIFLFVTVGGALAWTAWKYRTRKGDDPDFMPAQSHGHPLVEVGLVAASAFLLVVIAIPTFSGIVLKDTIPAEFEEGGVEIKVTGYRWWWGFEYESYGFHTANEIVFPAGEVIKLRLLADDVIHSFWLPKLAGKMDLIPGRENIMWIKADEPGEFWGQCAEYCGDSHAYMLFRARALSPADWKAWLEHQVSPSVVDANRGDFRPRGAAEAENSDSILKGAELFVENCARCHSVSPQSQTMGPNLAHFGSRSAIAAGWLENDPENLARWIKEPHKVKPGNYMWRGFLKEDGESVMMEGLDTVELDDEDIQHLVAYLYALK